MSEANTPQGTGDQPMSSTDAVDALAGLLDSQDAAPEEHDETPDEGQAPEEAEVEAEAEAEPDDGEQSDDDEADDGEIEASEETEEEVTPEVGEIEIDGERITLEEVKKGYLRQKDYTQKTQELSELRKSEAQRIQALEAERQRYAERIEQLSTLDAEPEPDWDTLRETDPIEYMLQRDQWREKSERKQALEAERQRLSQHQQQEQQQKLVKQLQSEQERLLSRVPEWRDEKIATKEKTEIASLMKDYGWTPEELGQLYDHRALLMARDALAYRRLQSKSTQVAAKAKGKPKVVKPGSAKPVDGKTRDAALKKVKRTGSVHDAVDYLLS
jgi:hypothetical protein